jgi:hypothetical protein
MSDGETNFEVVRKFGRVPTDGHCYHRICPGGIATGIFGTALGLPPDVSERTAEAVSRRRSVAPRAARDYL